MTLFNSLHFNNLKGDFSGGLAAALVALPLAIAFGVLSGAGPVSGITAAVLVGFFASLTGSTASQISGPTGPMSILMTLILLQYTSADPVHGLAIGFTVVMLAGILLLLFSALKVSQYINMIPHSVISGLMSGLGLSIILLQLGPLLGHASITSTWQSLLQLPTVLSHPASNTAIVGILALVLMYFQPKSIGKYIPSPLTALLIGTATYLLLFPDGMIKTIGATSLSLPLPQWPTFKAELIIDMLASALALAVLGTIDTLMTSLVADNVSRDRHDSDRELFGQGIANIVSGLFGGLAGAGASMRTVINVRHGGQTALSGLFHALIVLSLALLFGQFIELIPHAVLAAILIKVASDLVDWDYMKRLHKAPKAAIFIMFSVLLLTLFAELMIAIAAGITLASLMFMKSMSELQLQRTTASTTPEDELPLSEAELTYLRDAAGRILLFHVSGPMSFGAAKSMVKRVASVDNYEALVLDLSDVPLIDFSSSIAIEDIILDAQEAGHHIFICGASEPIKNLLAKHGIIDLLLEHHQYETRLDALKQACELLQPSL
ncbi:MAG: SulP family inorganic anion transporter [Gammaproteobacteria bacterium]|nr:SulP family inorganic anion transporter [Gammaproteobacteria bacterium]